LYLSAPSARRGFHLLQEALELVLGAVQLPGEPSDVCAPGEVEVAQDEVGRVELIRATAATFSPLIASKRPKLDFATSSSNALAVCDSTCS
jgi:hypothetical protein